jgi:hypothetical protein
MASVAVKVLLIDPIGTFVPAENEPPSSRSVTPNSHVQVAVVSWIANWAPGTPASPAKRTNSE